MSVCLTPYAREVPEIGFRRQEALRVLHRAAARTGAGRVSAQQLQRWNDAGVLSPTVREGSRGRHHSFAFEDLIAARALALLSGLGRLAQPVAREVVRELRLARLSHLDGMALVGDLERGSWRLLGRADAAVTVPMGVALSLDRLVDDLRAACAEEGLPEPLPPTYRQIHPRVDSTP